MDFSLSNIDSMLLEDFYVLKKDNEKFISFLQNLKLLPTERTCEKCHLVLGLKKDTVVDGYGFRCNTCRRRISLRKGTFFEGSKLLLWQIFLLMYLDVFDIQMSYSTLMRQLQIGSRETIVNWKNYIREIYVEYFNLYRTQIGGVDVIVQIDESNICKRKYHRGRVLVNQNVWIVGGVDENNNIFQVLTEVRDQSTLENIITTYVAPGSTIWTDMWRGYNSLESLGYKHESVNHSIQFKTTEGVHTNKIEAIWGAIKRKFRYITNKTSELVSSYLAAYQLKKS